MNIVTKTGKDLIRYSLDWKMRLSIDDTCVFRWRAKINKGPARGVEQTGSIKRVATISDIKKLHKAYGPLHCL